MPSFEDHAYKTYGSYKLWIFSAVLRFCQFILATIVCVLYGSDILFWKGNYKGHIDSKWFYAAGVAAVSIVTALVFILPFIQTQRCFIWDNVLT